MKYIAILALIMLLMLLSISGCVTTGKVVYEDVDIQTHFCRTEDCEQQLIAALSQAKERIHCAFYELGLPDLINTLSALDKKVDVLIMMEKENVPKLKKSFWLRTDTNPALMHNKFCVIDDNLVWTGSFNPTKNGNEKNDENAQLIKSVYLNQNYESEFKEMWYGTFAGGEPVQFPKIGNLENYFCPEDGCAQHVIDVLKTANCSIRFMIFSFTDDDIGDLLINKHNDGVLVQGVFEKTQNNPYTEYNKLAEAGIEVMWDKNPNNMHHKVFIIDDETVITGSYNPTANGNENNDENVLIIHDKNITDKYIGEFNRVYDSASDHTSDTTSEPE